MSALMYEKLFEPYTLQGQHLEGALKFIANLAAKKGISTEVVEVAVNEIFAEVANGREFSTTECSCGCGMDKASSDITHSIRDRMIEIDKESAAAVRNLIQERYRLFLEGEMRRISQGDKDIDKKLNGSFSQKFRKAVGLPYEKWVTEDDKWFKK